MRIDLSFLCIFDNNMNLVIQNIFFLFLLLLLQIDNIDKCLRCLANEGVNTEGLNSKGKFDLNQGVDDPKTKLNVWLQD